MAMETAIAVGDAATTLVVAVERESPPGPTPGSNLAALLDQFTRSITQPDLSTIGSFAATIDALHGELALLARHFGADFTAGPEAIDLDGSFPDAFDDGAERGESAIGAAIAGAADLEPQSVDLSRDKT